MTSPSDQTPIVPGYPQQPPPAYAPAGPPAKPPNSKLAYWTSPTGIVLMLTAAVFLIIGIALLTPSNASTAAKDLDITIVSCNFTGGDLSTATVGFTVTNHGKSTRTVVLHFEYRDSAGSRIDTDTSTVRNIAPGDTVRAEEPTLLDGPATSGTCHLTGIS